LLAPERIATAQGTAQALLDGLNQRLLGQQELVKMVVVACLSRGHVLLEGLPGLGKTELVKGMAGLLGLQFRRVQFTPDLLPGDVTGGPVLEEQDGRRTFVFKPGPIFGNIVLADEINRASPRTQAAMLEAMQERRVTVLGETHDLPKPFWVLATQNPIELEGTFPLPEAQLDRFLFNISVEYPSYSEELDIVRSVTGDDEPVLKEVVDASAILEFQHVVRRVPVSDHVQNYAVTMARATRPDEPDAPEFIKKLMAWGAGPRASLNLVLAGKARAALRGRCHVSIDDIRELCLPVLRHRIIPNFAARSEGMTADALIAKLMEEVPSDEKLLNKRAG
jgi:MoxR-like ATPase